MSAVERHHQQAPVAIEKDTPGEAELESSQQRFTASGHIPPVQSGFGAQQRSASELAFGPGEGQGEQSRGGQQAEDRVGRMAVIADLMLGMWETNTKIAKENADNGLRAKTPAGGPALAKAILSIGLDAFASRLFGHLIEKAIDGPEKAVLDLAQSTAKAGLANLAQQLGASVGLAIDPQQFAWLWQTQQLEAINAARGALVSVLETAQLTDTQRLASIERIRAAAPSSQTLTHVLVQQYSHALYYESGDGDYEADGLIDIGINVGRGPQNRTDLDDKGGLKTASVTIRGLDTKTLTRINSAFAPGIDPVALRMPFRISFWEMTDGDGTDREGNNESNHRGRELYFNNGGALQTSNREALDWLYKFGGRIPIAGGFGTRQPVVGWSRVVL